jgi:hypothetical protein
MKWYQNKFDQVEATITTKLREVLGATQTANEMFRIFSKFNALLVRPRIKVAIQQFQQQLLDQVKADIERLQVGWLVGVGVGGWLAEEVGALSPPAAPLEETHARTHERTQAGRRAASNLVRR